MKVTVQREIEIDFDEILARKVPVEDVLNELWEACSKADEYKFLAWCEALLEDR